MKEERELNMDDATPTKPLCTAHSQLAQRSDAGIPVACGGYAEIDAAHRLFYTPGATFQGVLEPHVSGTRERIARQAVALVVQHTTAVDQIWPGDIIHGEDLPGADGGRELFLQMMHAFTPDGVPMGTLLADMSFREPGSPDCAGRSRTGRAVSTGGEKESCRSLNMLRDLDKQAGLFPDTQLIFLGDGEFYIFDALSEPLRIGWIACPDRQPALLPDGDGVAASLHDHLLAQPVSCTQTFNVCGREATLAFEKDTRGRPRDSRRAVAEIRSATISLQPPGQTSAGLPAFTVNAVLVREAGTPAGGDPMEWILLTNLPVAGADQVRTQVGYYCARRMIKTFLRVLKLGCKTDEYGFEHIDQVAPCLAFYLIAAWRTLCVYSLGRSHPDIDCEAIFDPAEWNPVWMAFKKGAPPGKAPALGEIATMVAQLGGYIVRKNSPPGPQTIWSGLQRAYDFSLGWKMFFRGAGKPG